MQRILFCVRTVLQFRARTGAASLKHVFDVSRPRRIETFRAPVGAAPLKSCLRSRLRLVFWGDADI
jgi:hypothetical protein